MVELEDFIVLHERISRACQKYVAGGGKIASSPVVDGEACPMQAVAMEGPGAFGMMWFPWDVGPAQVLGISREWVWNFICGFDGKPAGLYHMSGKDGVPSVPELYDLGALMRSELIAP